MMNGREQPANNCESMEIVEGENNIFPYRFSKDTDLDITVDPHSVEPLKTRYPRFIINLKLSRDLHIYLSPALTRHHPDFHNIPDDSHIIYTVYKNDDMVFGGIYYDVHPCTISETIDNKQFNIIDEIQRGLGEELGSYYRESDVSRLDIYRNNNFFCVNINIINIRPLKNDKIHPVTRFRYREDRRDNNLTLDFQTGEGRIAPSCKKKYKVLIYIYGRKDNIENYFTSITHKIADHDEIHGFMVVGSHLRHEIKSNYEKQRQSDNQRNRYRNNNNWIKRDWDSDKSNAAVVYKVTYKGG